jgi:hypothetical protein
MISKYPLITIKLIGAMSLGSAPLVLALPCLAQTFRSTATIVRPSIIRPVSSRSLRSTPTIVRPVSFRSTTNFSSQIGAARSSNSCYQVDANSKIYIRHKGGGSRYYPNNNSSSYAQATTAHPRCD